VAAPAENRGICPGCSQMVTTAHPRTVDETSGKYWHRPCFDAKDKVGEDAKAGEPAAEDRGLCPVCTLMVTTAHPRTVDEPTGKYYHRSCFEDKDKVAAAEAEAEEQAVDGAGDGADADGGADAAADADAQKPGKKKRCTMEGCKKSAYKNNYCAQHFRETSGFTTVNFAKMMAGDNSMDMKQMTKNYKAMTMKMSKKGPAIGKSKPKKGSKKDGGEQDGEADGEGGEAEASAAPDAAAALPADFVQCRMCDESDPVHPATTRCQECEEDMCDVIARAHQRAKLSKGHTLILLADVKKTDAAATT